MLSVDRRSFPLASAKVVAIGHGIDTAAFACVEPRAGRAAARRRARAHLARQGPRDDRAGAAALAEVELEVYGPSITAEERAERARLLELGVRARAIRSPTREVRGLLARKDVLVNNMREGALDKIVYEAAATCMPVLASNSGFDDVLPAELRFRRDDPDELAAKLRRLAGRWTGTHSGTSSARASRTATRPATGPTRVLEVARR